MKKKIALCLVFMLCILSAVVGREKFGDFTKYDDKKNGYSGWASVKYMGTTKETDVYTEMQKLSAFIYRIKRNVPLPYTKLTNEESFLMWSALAEYSYKKGEMYYVSICDYPANRTKALDLYITITGKDTLE